MRKKVKPLDVVALLDNWPEAGLIEGQVGTVVERLDDTTALVEFADDSGVAYAIMPVSTSRLLVLNRLSVQMNSEEDSGGDALGLPERS